MDIPPRRSEERRRGISESNIETGNVTQESDHPLPSHVSTPISPKSRTCPEIGLGASATALEFGCDIDQPVCTPCEGKNQIKPSRSYCVKCKQYLCIRCARRHIGHAQLAGNTMPGIITVKTEPKGDSETCSEHGHVIDEYCCNHQCFCCRDCVSYRHRKCTLQSLDEMVSGSDIEELKRSVLESVQSQMKSLSIKRSLWTKRKELMSKERNDLIDEIRKMCYEAVEGIQTLEQVCETEISETTQAEITNVDEKLKKINKYIKQISEDMRLVGEPRLESKEKKFINIKAVQHRTQTKYNNVQTSSDDAVDSTQELKSKIFKLDTIQRIKSVHELVCPSSKRSGMNAPSCSDNNSKVSAIHLSKHSVQLPGDATVSEETCIAAIEPLGDNRVLITDEENRRLKLFDIQLRHVHHISLSSPPRGISAGLPRSCAVALPLEESVQLCDIENDVIVERNKVHVGVECTDVFVSSQGIIVCCFDHSSSPVKHFDFGGNLIHVFNFPTNVCKRPNYICANADASLLYVSDETEGVFVVDFHQNEEGVWQYRNTELECPQGITLDDEGRVYVVDFSSNFMHRLPMGVAGNGVSVKGALIDIGCKGPQCVCFLPKTREFLVAFDGHYDITRFKVTK